MYRRIAEGHDRQGLPDHVMQMGMQAVHAYLHPIQDSPLAIAPNCKGTHILTQF